MNTQDRKEYKDYSTRWAAGALIVGFILIFILPLMLTAPASSSRTDFSKTGQIGDTIGGITAPFMSLIGSIIVFFALRAQIRANQIITDHFEMERELQYITTLYNYFIQSIENFSVDKSEKSLGEFFEEISKYPAAAHIDPKLAAVSIRRVYFVINSAQFIIQKIEESRKLQPNDKRFYKDLLDQQLQLLIYPVIDTDNNIKPCKTCNESHKGIHPTVIEQISEIRKKLSPT